MTLVELGIDFGTTRTVVAVCDRGNYPVLGFLGPDGGTLDWYPSVVAEANGELVYGLEALDVAAADPSVDLIRSFKRHLSSPEIAPGSMVHIGNVEIEITEFIARFLEALRRDILERSNLPVKIKGKVEFRCVVATPANAHSTQRFITLEAFRRADFDCIALLNEPSAAGLEYAHRHRNTITSKREHILVYDLGGGTFDASLVRMSGKSHDVVASNGLARLGGDDFDAKLLDLVLETRKTAKKKISPRARAHLLDACRDAKERLNANSKRISIDVSQAFDSKDEEVITVSTDAFYAKCAPLVEETLATMNRVLARKGPDIIRNQSADFDGDLAADDVAGIYVVGGASSLPVIARMLRDAYGRRVHRSAYPSAATAIGLAIAMDERSGYELTERYSHHFGVFREARSGAEVAFDPIFDEATEQPKATNGGSFEQVRRYRAVHNVGHFRYIECGWLDDRGAPSGDITPFAEVYFPFDPELRDPKIELEKIPIERTTREGHLVEERYLVHAGGIVELTIRDLETGYERRLRLQGA